MMKEKEVKREQFMSWKVGRMDREYNKALSC